ncbi:MAG: hypothetical protein HY898_35230 [Deltaproteobacteria bacterium]|nr:hypothetical protein [Deltaproteobacteria bacterium]
MSLQPIYQKYESWLATVRQQCETLLAQARTQLVAAQSRPEADDKIARIEEIIRAKLEPILLEREDEVVPVQQAAERYFEQHESPSEADYQLKEKIDGGAGALRDWLERKLASLVAQARAQELAPGAPAPAAVVSRFCTGCGAPLKPADLAARRCPMCGLATAG